MANCISIDGSGGVVSVTPQPTDISTCQFVVLTPAEFTQASQAPDTTLAGQFFAFSFFMVVGAYLAGWAVGVLRRTVRSGAN